MTDRETTISLKGKMLDAIEEEIRKHPELWRSRTSWVHEAIREKLVRDRKHHEPPP